MSKQELKHYDAEYARKYLKTIENPYTKRKVNRVADILMGDPSTQGGTILDFGGNIHGTVKSGLRGALEVRGATPQYKVIDLAAEYFDPAFLKQHDPYVEIFDTVDGIVADIRETGLPAESADSVVLADVLEHVPYPAKAMTEVGRVLRPNGRLVMVSPALYKLDILKALHPHINERVARRRETSHVNFLSHPYLETLFAGGNLSDPATEGIGWASGFPFLLWGNEAYIPDDTPHAKTTPFSTVYKKVNSLGSVQLDELDRRMNTGDTAERFVRAFADDPLQMIHEVLKGLPSFSTNELAQQLYKDVRRQVDAVRESIDSTELSHLVKNLLDTHPASYFANSVILTAHKNS